MKAKDEIFLIKSDAASLDGGAEVVHPAEAAALAAALQPRPLRQRPPPPLAFLLDETGKDLVFVRGPWPFLDPHLAAARCLAHFTRWLMTL